MDEWAMNEGVNWIAIEDSFPEMHTDTTTPVSPTDPKRYAEKVALEIKIAAGLSRHYLGPGS